MEELAKRRQNGVVDCCGILPWVCEHVPELATGAFTRASSSPVAAVRALAMSQLILIEPIDRSAAVRICEEGITDNDEKTRTLALRALVSFCQ